MKKLSIVSIGMGGETLTLAASRAIEQAEALLGAPRMLADFSKQRKPVFPVYASEPVAEVLAREPYRTFALLVSGDAGFFSAADAVASSLADCEIEVLPGISSLQYLFAKLHRPWQEAAIVSCHGRECNLADTVRRSSLTFALTGGNAAELAQQLVDAGFGALRVTIGQNLGMEDMRIKTCSAAEVAAAGAGSLTVLLIENPQFDPRVRCGIPDEAFIRGDVPMTKAEVRAVTLSKLAIAPDDICYDVGAGTGSVTVEMALAAYGGKVFAIEQKESAIRLVQQNCAAFHIGNVVPVLGTAPDALAALPVPDAVFIGGSGGNMRSIFDAVLERNPNVRVVVNAIALESVQAALAAFCAYGIEPEIVQLGVSKTRLVGGLHMLTANNPVFIISGGGHA